MRATHNLRKSNEITDCLLEPWLFDYVKCGQHINRFLTKKHFFKLCRTDKATPVNQRLFQHKLPLWHKQLSSLLLHHLHAKNFECYQKRIIVFTKPVWSEFINEEKTFFKWPSETFADNVMPEFRSDIGLKFKHTFPFLYRRVIIAVLTTLWELFSLIGIWIISKT